MKIRSLLVATAILLSSATAAQAGVYSDDMGKCLVRSSSDADKNGLVVWLFSAISTHPAVSEYAKVTPEQRTENDKRMVALFERLVTVDCRKETVAALKYEGTQSFEGAFRILGEVAMRTLMSEPSVTANMSQLAKYLDESKFEALGKEAGLQQKPAGAPK